MKTQTLIISVLMLMALPAASFAQPAYPDSLTLEQSINLTIANHPLVQQAASGVAAASARVDASRSSYYPDVSLVALYARLDPVPSMAFPGLGTFRLYPEDNYDFHLGIEQMLYDFGRTGTSVKLAESGHKSAQDDVELVKFTLAYQTVAAFKTALILRETIHVLDDQIDVLQAHLDASTQKVRAGTATEFDTLTTAVRIALVRSQRIDATRALDDQHTALRRLTGWPAERPLNLKGRFVEDMISVNPDSIMAVAMRQRPELVRSADAESTATIQAQLAALGQRPSLALAFTSGFKNGYIPDIDEWKGNIAVGVQLRFPIFDGFETRSRKAEASANLHSAEMHTADVRREVTSDVDRAVTGVRTSLEKLRTADVQVRQADEALSMAQTRYQAGVATNLDVLDAQTSLSDVRLTRLRALYEYTVSVSALDRAMGRKPW